MAIRHIRSLKEHDELLELKKDTLVVLDFHASWCGPCHQIAPVFEQLSRSTPQAAFAKVDVDAVGEVARKYKIAAMPTFLFIKNKVVVETIRGANSTALSQSVTKHATGTFSSGSGQTATDSTGDMSLLEFVDTQQLNCLNESSNYGIKALLASKSRNTSSDKYLLSDADEQLLINIAFNQIVKVRSLVFHTTDPSAGPKEVKIIANNRNLSFEDFEDDAAVTQTIDVTEDDLRESKKINVRFVRFQSVTTLSIFVGSNHGGVDETRIDAIDIYGMPVQTTADLSGLRKQEE